uniref:Venom peptide n=1 Tax=Angiostrongylus cantonensis TaxID=6313 RepID=A0A0K0DK27_ANGCA
MRLLPTFVLMMIVCVVADNSEEDNLYSSYDHETPAPKVASFEDVLAYLNRTHRKHPRSNSANEPIPELE